MQMPVSFFHLFEGSFLLEQILLKLLLEVYLLCCLVKVSLRHLALGPSQHPLDFEARILCHFEVVGLRSVLATILALQLLLKLIWNIEDIMTYTFLDYFGLHYALHTFE